MTLRANADEVAIAQIMKIHWRINRALRIRLLACGHLDDVLRRRSVTHLAINARLFEFHIVHIEAAAFYISQLARVANRADGLITGGSSESLPGTYVTAFTGTAIDNFPVVDPTFLQRTVLDGKDVNLAAGQLGGVGLLEL